MNDDPNENSLPIRSHPIHGVHRTLNLPTVVFLTVCTKGRRPYLASQNVHELLVGAWNKADAWLVGRYVVMPDHIHLFAGPAGRDISFDHWVRFWKSHFTRHCNIRDHAWQSDHWDRRLRDDESYEQKWDYVRQNPVRHGLVKIADDWPFQGELHRLPWR
jgi:REP element-mobilizing transposase RayT